MGNDMQLPVTSQQRRRQLLVSRQKSLSDGSLPSSGPHQLHQDSIPALREREPQVVIVSARDLDGPTLQGYIERASPGANTIKDWHSVWCVLKDSSLYVYGSPIEESTKDCVELPGWSIQECEDISHPYCLQLVHPNYHVEYLATETAAEMSDWLQAIHQVAQKVSIDGLSLEHGRSKEFDKVEGSASGQWEEELLLLRKRQLLKMVLQQKEELEERLICKDDTKTFLERSHGPPVTGGRLLGSEGDKVHDITLLKQRRASARIKADNVQRQLQGLHDKRTKKKSRFSLGGLRRGSNPVNGPASEAPLIQEGALEEQLHELTQKLETIEQDLNLKQQGQNALDMMDAPLMTSSTNSLAITSSKLGISAFKNNSLSASADSLIPKSQQAQNLQKCVGRTQSAMLTRVLTEPAIARSQSATFSSDRCLPPPPPNKSRGKNKMAASQKPLSQLPEGYVNHASSFSIGPPVKSEISQEALDHIEDFEQLIEERLQQSAS